MATSRCDTRWINTIQGFEQEPLLTVSKGFAEQSLDEPGWRFNCGTPIESVLK